MQSVSYPKLDLTSRVIPSNPDGEYSFDQVGFLVPHEMLRRELTKGSKAIENVDTINKRWTSEAFCEWLNDLMIPLLHAHHYIEDQIIFPFYLTLGMIAPESQEEDHVKLVGRMNKLQSLIRQLRHFNHCSTQYGENVVQQITGLETKLKKEYLDMVDHILTHFDEEERFWPEILRSYGAQNWYKAERIILNYTVSFGDHNAGDPYRLTICAVARAMGIAIGKESIDANNANTNNELPWAGVAIQERYINSRPWIISKWNITSWNVRYMQFHYLITSVMNASSNVVPKKLSPFSEGKYVARLPKPFVPIILFVFLSIVYCLATLPLFAAVASPLENLKFLHVKIINYDSPARGSIGTAFLSFIGNVAASSDEIPSFIIESPDVDINEYEHRVLNGEAWALIAVNPNATSLLNKAFANGCQNAASYNPEGAMTFSWDEGRNNIVSDPYIQGFLTSILPSFISLYASQQLTTMSPSDVLGCISSGHAELLVTPINYLNHNLTPVDISQVVTNAGLLLGVTLMSVFGSMYIVMATYDATTALVEDYGPKGKVFLKAFTMALIGFGLSIYFATAMVGMTYHGSSHHLYSGTEWAQVFAVQWIHIMIWSFSMGCVYESMGGSMVPIVFMVLLLWNTIGGWNIDLAPQGYKHFFQIFPFHWVIYLLRYTFYKSQGFHRGISAGILIAYWIVSVAGYLYLGIRNETQIHNGKKIFVYEEAGNPNLENCVDNSHTINENNNNKNEDHRKNEHHDPIGTAAKSLGYSGHVVYHIVKNNKDNKKENNSDEYTNNSHDNDHGESREVELVKV